MEMSPCGVLSVWHEIQGRTCWGPALCQRPLSWRLHVPSEHVSTWAHQPCALAAPGAPRVPARPRAPRPRLGGLPTPRGCSPGVSRPLRAARGCGRGSPTPQGRSEARRRQGGGRALGERALPAAASGPRPRLARPAAGRCRERRRWGAARRPGGRGPEAEPGEPAAHTALPATSEADPRTPLGSPWVSSKIPPGCPSISLGDYSVCFVFLSSFPPCVPFSRMAEAELHKERLQAIAVSPLSFYFLALLSGMEEDPECFGAVDIPAQ